MGELPTAFRRAREGLVEKGLVKYRDDVYRLGNKATQGRHRQCRQIQPFTCVVSDVMMIFTSTQTLIRSGAQ
jgi:hypothetical protein